MQFEILEFSFHDPALRQPFLGEMLRVQTGIPSQRIYVNDKQKRFRTWNTRALSTNECSGLKNLVILNLIDLNICQLQTVNDV